MDDPHDLRRFVDAQAPVYARVTAELRAGRKASHWIWFVFPQIAGLGRSATAQHYAIQSLDEAAAYLANPVLGPRLLDCTRLATAVPDRSARTIFGEPDDLKFRSCVTLFARVPPEHEEFPAALDRFFGGEPDLATLERLR